MDKWYEFFVAFHLFIYFYYIYFSKQNNLHFFWVYVKLLTWLKDRDIGMEEKRYFDDNTITQKKKKDRGRFEILSYILFVCVKYVWEDKDRKIINNSNNNNLMCIVYILKGEDATVVQWMKWMFAYQAFFFCEYLHWCPKPQPYVSLPTFFFLYVYTCYFRRDNVR